MSGKSAGASPEKGRGTSCPLEVVKQFLQTGLFPDGYTRNDRSVLRRRARSFVLVDGELYFTGGRSRHNRSLRQGEKDDIENPEIEPDRTQVLRKVLFSSEEQREVVDKAHIGEDGSHYGIEKTTERVSNIYYWMGIVYSVRSTIHNCLHCSARTKTAGSAMGLKRQTPARSRKIPTSLVLASGDLATSSVFARLNEDDGSNDCDAGFWNDGTLKMESSEMGQTPETVPAVIKREAADLFFVPKDVCSHFWQKVEIQMFGPFQAGSKQVYVTVALDSYSQFPEATIMDVLSTATLTNFILNLFCRYGMMEKLSFLQNKLTLNKEIFINTQDMQQAGIFPTLLFPHVNPLDARWRHIEQSLGNFVGLYPDFWYYCLEAFMVPLRITLPPEADYTPYFLVHGREPPIPEKMSAIFSTGSLTTSEIQLTEEQEKQTVAMLTTAYGIFSDHPSIPAYVPEPSTTAEVNGSSKGDFAETRGKKKKHGRSSSKRKFVAEKAEEDQELKYKTEKEERERTSSAQQDDSDDPAFDIAYDSDKECASGSTVHKRKRAHPCKKKKSPTKGKKKKATKEPLSEIATNLQKHSLDAFYFIIKQHLEQGLFPPGASDHTKQSIAQLSQLVLLHDGKMYSNAGKSTGRLLVTGEKARLGMLRKAHVRGEVHHGRAVVLKHLSEMNVFWKGISLDLDAFLHGCPECLVHNPLRNKDFVTIPSKSSQLSPQEKDSADAHLAEDEEEESSYEDLIQFLTDGTFPSASTPQQQRRIRQRSESFCMIDGSLHYSGDSGDRKTPGSTGHPRQVLFTESWRNSAIKEAHIEDGMHLSPQDTQAKLRRRYFWSGMTFDILTQVIDCCMKEYLTPSVCVLHRSPIIQQRVDKFHGYLRRENIPILDTSIIKGFESDAGVPDSQKVDTDIVETVEKIIDDVGKSLTGENRVLESKESGSQRLDPKGKLPTSKYGGRKDAHKCPHCGKFISGNVAYRVHMYKHTGMKPFSCATCGKTFVTTKGVRAHTRRHTGIKPYLCNQCGQEFFHRATLLKHLEAHEKGEKTPLSCDMCSRSFSNKHRLAKHKTFKHPAQVKVHMCNQCGKCFSAARSLKRHEQVHTGIRKYQCQYCTKAFFRKEYLNAHLSNHSEYDPELEKLKPRKKASKKPAPPPTQGHAVSMNTMGAQPIDVNHAMNRQEIMLHHYTMPVQYDMGWSL